MNRIFEILRNPSRVGLKLLKIFGGMLSDRMFLKIQFRLKMGYPLDLDNPQTFNEKLQWLKLYNRKPEYTKLVDKYEVKQYVSSMIGEDHIIPTLGLWNRFEEIDFDKLPNRFVLKTTNGGGGGGVVICKDKNKFDRAKAKLILERSMRSSIYKACKEWPYKDVKPRILAEKYMEDESGELRDFKFTCADGVAHNVMICFDRFTGDTKFYFFDREWNLLRLNKRGLAAPSDFCIEKPKGVEEMFDIAGRLSENLPYARVDLYNVNGKIYFGEITFYPQSGYDSNLLEETDKLFSSYINIHRLSL